MPGETAYEERFSALVRGNQPEERYKWALKAKAEGKKVIGLLCTYVPEELVYAAGMFPVRVTGTWKMNITKSLAWRDLDMCKYATHVLESMLDGELDFLDGIIASDWDDDRRRLYDVWKLAGKQSFIEIITIPKKKTELSFGYFERVLIQLASSLEDLCGHKITASNLNDAINLHNQTRELIAEVYELRKQEAPPVTGSEVLGLTTASMVMDKTEFNRELKALLDHIKHRASGATPDQPRILVSSDLLDNPAYFELIEDEGAIVAMDDLDTGSRFFSEQIETDTNDPLGAIARRYVMRPGDPPAFDWDRQIKQIIDWTVQYNIDGVIEMADDFSPPRRWRWPFFSRELTRAGIPFNRIFREYGAGAMAPLRNRIGAFLEMLSDDLA